MTALLPYEGLETIDAGPSDRKRVLFVCSSGGHLSQLLQLRAWWEHHERRWVTFDLPDARSKLEGEELIAAHHPTTRNLVNLARNAALARSVIKGYEPDVVVSNGAGVAVPFFALAKARGIPTVYSGGLRPGRLSHVDGSVVSSVHQPVPRAVA